MQLFYTPRIDSDTHILNSDESKHCLKVLRKQEGDSIKLVDGKGSLYTAIIAVANLKKCILNIVATDKLEKTPKSAIHLVVAPTKNNDRYEWFLEKATEIGISSITPIVCEHSERKVIKPDRLKSILISAMKQSNRAFLPSLNELVSFDEFLNKPFQGDAFIAHCKNSEKCLFKEAVRMGQEITVLIGPEGDFSSNEILKAEQNGYKSVSLGVSRLRTETAAIVACHTINLINQ